MLSRQSISKGMDEKRTSSLAIGSIALLLMLMFWPQERNEMWLILMALPFMMTCYATITRLGIIESILIICSLIIITMGLQNIDYVSPVVVGIVCAALFLHFDAHQPRLTEKK